MPDIENYSRSDFERAKESCKNAKNGGVIYFMTYIFISRQGQTTWNTDCADDADAHGYELPIPRISAQSAASAFPFRFDDYYFINPHQIKFIYRPRFSGHYQFLSAYPSDQKKFKIIGIDNPEDYAIFQNKGYQGLYNGLGVKDIHKRKGLNKNQKILDHMGSTELAANLFRATQTDDKLRRENIRGKENANTTHFVVGKKIYHKYRILEKACQDNM